MPRRCLGVAGSRHDLLEEIADHVPDLPPQFGGAVGEAQAVADNAPDSDPCELDDERRSRDRAVNGSACPRQTTRPPKPRAMSDASGTTAQERDAAVRDAGLWVGNFRRAVSRGPRPRSFRVLS